MNNEELVKLVAEAYVYGYPMVYTIEEQIKHNKGGYAGGSPVNVMGFTDKLIGPETDFVSVNSDSLYMMLEAQVVLDGSWTPPPVRKA